MKELLSRRFAIVLGVLFAAAIAGADETSGEVCDAKCAAAGIRLAQGQEAEASRRERLNEAENLLEKNEYEKALAIADQVLAEVEKDKAKLEAEVLSSLRKKALKLDYEIRLAWFRALMKEARHAVSEGRYQAASEAGSKAKALIVAPVGALAANPSIFDDEKTISERFLEFCRRAQKNVEQYEATTVDRFEPQSAAEKKKIRQLLQEAETFMKSSRLQDAQSRVEQVFLIDPCNTDAIALAGKIYNKLYAFGEARRHADLEGVFSHADWQWVEPVFPEINGGNSAQEQGHVKASDNDRALARMDQIVFPLVEFEDADVSAVLDWISRRSATYSPDHRAVAISKMFPAGSNWRVSLSLKNIPMSVVLRYICQQTGLKYRADNDSVFIGPEVDEMISRRFTVPSALSNYVAGGGAGDASGEAASGDSEGSSASSASAVGPSEDDWKNYFRERGIGFPDGSKVNYSSQAKMLIVRNTPENLQQLDILLRQLETVANKPLIMIEIKSVEVKENDMQELGFEWALGTDQSGGNVSYGVGSGLYMDPISGSTYLKKGKSVGWLLNQGLNTVEKGILSAIRGDGSSTNSTVVEKLNLFPALFGSTHPFGSDNALNINLTINALDQNKRVETLSAPKVVTSNDVEAEVSLGKTYYFPDSWDTLEVEVDTGDNTSTTTITPPVPNFPEEGTEIGIVFKVKPQVLADNRTIRMSLEPSISTYEGDDRYDMYLYYDRYEAGLPVPGQIHVPGERFSIYKPIINRREMKLECDLDNGETVVLGGLVKSNTTSRVDKVPLLGDLPLIGRLFQSHSDNAERTNLLFFVTARLLSYDGVPIERNNTPGLPDFNR